MTAADAVVYVVDDDRDVRESLASLLRSMGLRVEAFASAEEFLRHPRGNAPSCLVLDVLLPGSSGLELPRALRDAGDAIPVIFITGHGTIPMSVRAMKDGALEFLEKPFREEELVRAIHEALERDGAARREQGELAELRKRWERLTPRERDVLALVVKGRMNKQIAMELGAAEQTIKVHRGRVMRKMEARSVPELVRFVERIADQPWAAAPPPPRRQGAGGADSSVIPR